MANKVNEQVKHEGKPIRAIPKLRKPIGDKRPIPAWKFLLAVALCLASCGNKSQRAEEADIAEATNVDSVQQWNTIKDIGIPRSHLGITLGMPYSEAKQLLLENVCKGLDEDYDDKHNSIYVEKDGDWLGDWGTKYSTFSIGIFDGKLFSINVEPQDNPAEVIEALKQKYPFEVEENEEFCYYGNGLVTKSIKRNYSCSNGITEIYLDDYSNTIRYRDVKLKNEKSAYWDKVEAAAAAEKEKQVNQQLSDY